MIRNILKTVTDTRLDHREDFFESSRGLSIDTVRFDLRWPWGVKNQGHTFWREICQERQQLRPIGFTLDDLQRLKVKVTNGPVTAIGMSGYTPVRITDVLVIFCRLLLMRTSVSNKLDTDTGLCHGIMRRNFYPSKFVECVVAQKL